VPRLRIINLTQGLDFSPMEALTKLRKNFLDEALETHGTHTAFSPTKLF